MNRDQIALINAFMGQQPVFSEPLIASAKILCSNGHTNEALHLFRRALVIEPDSMEAMFDMEICLRQKGTGNLHEIVDKMVPVMKLSENSRIKFLMRWILENSNRKNFSIDFLNLLNLEIQKGKNSEEYPQLLLFKAQFLLNQAYLRLIDRDFLKEAETYFQMVIEYGGREVRRAWRALAEINFLLGEKDRSLEYSLKALSEDLPYSFLTRAVILWNIGDKGEALRHVNEGIRVRNRHIQTTKVSEEIKQYIEEALDGLEESERQDFRTEIRKWELSSYYLGYCPTHGNLKPYFTLQRRGERKSLKVTHYIAGKGERIEHR